MVDTHCHIYSEYYDNIEEVIKRALNNGVKALIVNGVDMKSNKEVLELVKKYDCVYGALGIQPEDISDNYLDDIKFINEHINDYKIIAVGEIGLDYHYECDKDLQKDVFERQLDIAQKFNKPVIIHSRDSIQDTYDILKKYPIKGIMHCYSGSVEMAHLFNKLGFLLGIGGICTFKNARRLIDVIKEISLEYIVLETDSPYLAPVPYRGLKNEPANISVIVQRISEIKGLDYKEVERGTTASVLRLFDKNIKL